MRQEYMLNQAPGSVYSLLLFFVLFGCAAMLSGWNLHQIVARDLGVAIPAGSPLDANGDLRVSPQEFASYYAARANEIDLNRDGKIELAEIEAYREQERRLQVESLLRAFDQDRDGVVSVRELSAAGQVGHAR